MIYITRINKRRSFALILEEIMEKKCVVLCGGGTGGHIYPNLALAPDLAPFRKICYIGNNGGMEEKLCKTVGIEFFGIDAPKFHRKITLQNLKLPYSISKSVKQAKIILQKLTPTVVFSKGGYVALPVCLAALSLGITVFCHESDLTMGLANKITYKKGGLLLTSFPTTMTDKKRVIHTGAPLRGELFDTIRQISPPKSHKNTLDRLLIIGGSQGAKTINEAVIANLPSLAAKFEITHITGKGKLISMEEITRQYQHLHPIALETMLARYHAIEYASDMGAVYKSADIAVSRGGANALFELLEFEIPTLVIPLEKGSRGDQVQNAEYFSAKKLCHTLSENHIFGFIECISALAKDKETIKQNIQIEKQSCVFDGRKNIVNLILGSRE